MQSFTSRLLPPAMTILRFKRPFLTAANTLARMRQEQRHPKRFTPPRHLSRTVDVTLDTSSGWPVYTVSPKGRSAPRRAIYLHGGTYVFQISYQHWMLVADLAVSTNTAFTVPIYPLAPKATADTIVVMAADLVEALIAEVGADRTSILGDSAGGGMALAVAMVLRDRGFSTANGTAPHGTEPHGTAPHATVLISPWLDISGTDPELARIAPRDPWLAVEGCHAAGAVYRGPVAEDDPIVSPINGSLEGLGAITMLSGTRDILNADAKRLMRLAAESNAAGVAVNIHYVEAPEMLHVYPLLPIPEAKAGRQMIRDAIAG
jgi:acetyl esterase/lipase